MKKNTKSIIAILMAVMMICVSFAACKANEKTVNKDNVSESDTVSVNASVPEGQTSNIAPETTTEKETTTAKKQENTTKKKVETTTKKKVETTTKKKVTTTKKAVTTTKKKVTTTKAAQKNVSPN